MPVQCDGEVGKTEEQSGTHMAEQKTHLENVNKCWLSVNYKRKIYHFKKCLFLGLGVWPSDSACLAFSEALGLVSANHTNK